jgi:hypothetical protein
VNATAVGGPSGQVYVAINHPQPTYYRDTRIGEQRVMSKPQPVVGALLSLSQGLFVVSGIYYVRKHPDGAPLLTHWEVAGPAAMMLVFAVWAVVDALRQRRLKNGI